LDDVVLELELTPNRSDCLGMWNVAREVAAMTGGRLHLPQVAESEGGGADAWVRIEAPDLCPRLSARLADQIRVESSPAWLKQRLMAMGVRSINNIVDISNLVMLETNQPLHFYDYDTLAEHGLVVRRALDGEQLTTLDGQVRRLTGEMMVIADADKAVGLAGVMGGLNTEVTDHTRKILIEAACFDPVSIRRTARTTGLHSEASQRFERGVDITQTQLAADRAVQMLELIGAGRGLAGAADARGDLKASPKIALTLEKVNGDLGVQLEASAVRGILESLHIAILEDHGLSWVTQPPSWRGDLNIEADLVEEVARLYGYDHVDTTLPASEGGGGAATRTPSQKLRGHLARFMAGQGFLEIIPYSFINPDHWARLQVAEGHPWRDAAEILNPLSEDQRIMRTVMLPSLLDTAVGNLNRRNRNLRLFEIGKIYKKHPKPGGHPAEIWTLGAICTGGQEKSWLGHEIKYEFYYLKGVLEALFKAVSVPGARFVPESALPGLHPGRCARIEAEGRELGFIGEIHPKTADAYGIDQRAVAFSLDVEQLLQVLRIEDYKPAPRYPSLTRDLAVTLSDQIPAQTLLDAVYRLGGETLKEARLFDVYQGAQIAAGNKSVAVALTWQSQDKTLTDQEVNELQDHIEKGLGDLFSGRIRGRQ
jgi:phenylalanyl-tRNA synthetase beta chain